MIEDDWIVYCPSYKRADAAMTHKLFSKKRFVYVVREEEAESYRKFGYQIKEIPKGAVSNIADTRNWILDNSDFRNIVMADDDISKILHLYKRDRITLDKNQIEAEIEKMFDLSYNLGISFWGMNLVQDPIGYSINKPFSFHTPILGPFCGHIIDEIRYDEDLSLKEDYDYFLQKVNKYGFCIRANFLSYQCDHQKMKGGCQEYRSIEEERKQQKMLQDKWGDKIVRYNERNSESINMKIRL
jgi:hypothetical protein